MISPQAGLGGHDQAVGEDRDGQRLDVVGDGERPALEQGSGLDGAVKGEGAARAHAESHPLVVTRGADELDQVAADGVADGHLPTLVLKSR